MKDKYNLLKNKIIYEIFPRNYSKSGTFNDIYNDLDRIKKLGVDIIWFMPFYPIGNINRKGKYGSPYSIKKYKEISKEFGNFDQFQKIIEKSKDLDMKIIIDIVFNHTSLDSEISNNKNWFIMNEKGEYKRKEPDWTDIIDLDIKNEELQKYLIDVLLFWKEIGVDGYRCDVASLISIDFWKKAKREVDSDNDLIWLAESLEPNYILNLRNKGYNVLSDNELLEVFDITYDYDGYQYLNEYFHGEKDLTDIIDFLKFQQSIYPQKSIKMRFLENHDKPRIANIISSKNRLKNWTLFYMMLPGIPLIYAGQEIKTNIYPSLFEKSSINWNDGDYEFLNFIKKIIIISKNIKEKGNFLKIKELKKGVVLLEWENKKFKYIFILNLEDKFGEINLDYSYSGEDLINNKNVIIEKTLSITKEPIAIKVKK